MTDFDRISNTNRCTMKLINLLIWLTVTHSTLADNVVADVCKGMQGISTCKAIFDIPTGAQVKTCPNKWFKVSENYAMIEERTKKEI